AKNAFLPKWVLGGDLLGESVELNKERFEQLQKEKKLIQMPALDKEKLNEQIRNYKLTLIETRDPVQLAPGIWTSGEIELPIKEELTTGLYVQKNDALIFDDFRDENSIFINVKNKGLIILTACAHTGIMNTVKMAQKIFGIGKIYALIGGYHMNWASKERIDSTIEFLKEINPEILSAMHCSGFKFTARLMDEIADSTVLGIVGTEFNL
ncbi:MAG TPA: MBL fold metallo-hydrolase, partial [Candidatus Methanoperedens sp.]